MKHQDQLTQHLSFQRVAKSHSQIDKFFQWQTKQTRMLMPAIHFNRMYCTWEFLQQHKVHLYMQKAQHGLLYVRNQQAFASQAKAPRHNSFRVMSGKGIWHKTLPNQTCGATCCGDQGAAESHFKEPDTIQSLVSKAVSWLVG